MRKVLTVLVLLTAATAFAAVEPLRVPLGGRNRVFPPGKPSLLPAPPPAAPKNGVIPSGALRPRPIAPVERPKLDREKQRKEMEGQMERKLGELRRISGQMETTTADGLRRQFKLDKPDALKGLNDAARRDLDENLRATADRLRQAGAEIRQALPPEEKKGRGW